MPDAEAPVPTVLGSDLSTESEVLLEVAAIASTALVFRGDAERFLTAPVSCSLALGLAAAAGLAPGLAVRSDFDFAAGLDAAFDFAAGLESAFAAASASGFASVDLLSLADLPFLAVALLLRGALLLAFTTLNAKPSAEPVVVDEKAKLVLLKCVRDVSC